jgi:DNA-binding transcriptional regulator YdaS (Cro superfamily)
MKTVEKVIAYFGSQTKAAKALGVNPQTIHNWISRGIPAKQAKAIHLKTNKNFSLEELLK